MEIKERFLGQPGKTISFEEWLVKFNEHFPTNYDVERAFRDETLKLLYKDLTN
jgi:hypothetical protein